jgi:Flp pilus assembly pilin Flp
MAVSVPVRFHKFLRSEQGQNLSEYCLITAAIAVVGLLIILGVTGGLHNIWQIASATTNAANSSGGGTVAGH